MELSVGLGAGFAKMRWTTVGKVARLGDRGVKMGVRSFLWYCEDSTVPNRCHTYISCREWSAKPPRSEATDQVKTQ